MDRTVKDVRELWDEYIVGRNGRLPVREMSQRPEFRKSEKEKRMFNRRWPIYDSIKGIASKRGMSESEAAALVEAFRVQKGYKLNKLSEKIQDHIEKGEL